MNTTQEDQAPQDALNSPAATTAAEPSAQPESAKLPEKEPFKPHTPMERLGVWAHKHHDFMNSKFARIAIRNIGSCVIGIAALTPVFVGDKTALNAIANRYTTGFDGNGNRTYSGNAATRTLAATAANDTFKQVTAVGLSFSTYRIVNKACKAVFDMLSEQHESEEAAAKTASQVKGTFAQFIGKFAKFEFLATMPAAVWLVLTQSPFGNGPGGFNSQNNKKSWLKASAIAGLVSYPGFFTITNAIFKKSTGHTGALQEVVAQAQKGDTPEFTPQEEFVHKTGLDQHPVAKRLSHTKEPEERAPTLIDKGLGFAKFTAAIATGIVGYYYTKRGLNFKTGMMKVPTMKPDGATTPGNGFIKNNLKEGLGYESFFVFTAIEEMMNMILDKPVKKLAGFLNRKVYGKELETPGPQPVQVAQAKPVEADAGMAEAPARSFANGEKSNTVGDLVAAGARPLGEKGDGSLQPSPV